MDNAIEYFNNAVFHDHITIDALPIIIAKRLNPEQQEELYRQLADIVSPEQLTALKNCVTLVSWILTPGKYDNIKTTLAKEYYSLING